MEKYKIRISFATYYALLDDMYNFDYLHNDGTPNKNYFFNTLIQGFYSNYKKRRENVEGLIKKYINVKGKNKVEYENLIKTITLNLNKLYYSDFHYRYHNTSIFIYPSNGTKELFDEIEINELSDESMSEFIRNLLNEYISIPFFERERCLYWNQFVKIEKAIENNKIIYMYLKDNTKIEMIPVGIFTSIEEKYNYVVGKMKTSKGLINFSIKLSKIKSVIISNQQYDLSKTELNEIQEQLNNGPEFMSKENTHAVIQFTKYGIKRFKACYKDRPVPTLIRDEGIYIFDADINKLFLYLIQFGKHIKVIEPIELKEKLIKFYKEAIEKN